MTGVSQRYFGCTQEESTFPEILSSPIEVAEFIVRRGQSSDLTVTDENGQIVCTTYGIDLDRCPDRKFLQELLRYLLPMQKKLFL